MVRLHHQWASRIGKSDRIRVSHWFVMRKIPSPELPQLRLEYARLTWLFGSSKDGIK